MSEGSENELQKNIVLWEHPAENMCPSRGDGVGQTSFFVTRKGGGQRPASSDAFTVNFGKNCKFFNFLKRRKP